MRNWIKKIFPDENKKVKWIAVIITVFIAVLLTLLGIYGIKQYGIGLFILTPFFIGCCSTILYGFKQTITFKQAWQIGFLSLAVYSLILLIFAIEGILCIAMVAPIAFLLSWIGSFTGFVIIEKTPNSGPTVLMVLAGIIPLMSFVESNNTLELDSVVTSIVIKADPQLVWKNVIQFPQLDNPTEFIFKIGIAYPINAKIEGTGVGAIRHCNFTTGSFVEPMIVWDEPHLLKFNVLEQPAPLKELSFWDIDAPHLHDYFVSKQGQFKLTKLKNGDTLLEGTTWYYHNISPSFYWKLWSQYIIHKIHERVLTHIKKKSENKSQLPL